MFTRPLLPPHKKQCTTRFPAPNPLQWGLSDAVLLWKGVSFPFQLSGPHDFEYCLTFQVLPCDSSDSYVDPSTSSATKTLSRVDFIFLYYVIVMISLSLHAVSGLQQLPVHKDANASRWQ